MEPLDVFFRPFGRKSEPPRTVLLSNVPDALTLGISSRHSNRSGRASPRTRPGEAGGPVARPRLRADAWAAGVGRVRPLGAPGRGRVALSGGGRPRNAPSRSRLGDRG